jgi:hypothetical protein
MTCHERAAHSTFRRIKAEPLGIQGVSYRVALTVQNSNQLMVDLARIQGL